MEILKYFESAAYPLNKCTFMEEFRLKVLPSRDKRTITIELLLIGHKPWFYNKGTNEGI